MNERGLTALMAAIIYGSWNVGPENRPDITAQEAVEFADEILGLIDRRRENCEEMRWRRRIAERDAAAERIRREDEQGGVA